ncbi:unnamed protein product [Trifolium pratense]|uniref:Uncharacterized protein n=1 Tax=Trifolium pratense TaxID=57577 RepID=A0ACB0JFQ4_TRIPR|nr:unnamed protein product [Trifolium pratense]
MNLQASGSTFKLRLTFILHSTLGYIIWELGCKLPKRYWCEKGRCCDYLFVDANGTSYHNAFLCSHWCCSFGCICRVFFRVSIDVCITYHNTSALKREDTKWTEGQDIWWQARRLKDAISQIDTKLEEIKVSEMKVSAQSDLRHQVSLVVHPKHQALEAALVHYGADDKKRNAQRAKAKWLCLGEWYVYVHFQHHAITI